MKTTKTIIITAALLFCAGALQADRTGFVTIGHPGNAADTTGYGAVAYSYRIAKYEVSVRDWDVFYRDRTSGKTGSFNQRFGIWEVSHDLGPTAPLARASFHQAAQYCNWLTTGSAIKGAYTIDGSGKVTAIDRTFRNAEGKLYVLPTEDEWYKAAYFKPDGSGYSRYADGTDTAPVKSTDGLTGWNYDKASLGWYHRDIPWKSRLGTQEQNGTCNMMGNVEEWVEDLAGTVRGGTCSGDERALSSSGRRTNVDLTAETTRLGFRIVLIQN